MVSNHGKLVIGRQPPPTLEDFYTINKNERGTNINIPTSYLHLVRMEIGYGNYISLGGNHYVLTLVDISTIYFWTYSVCPFYGAHVIQIIQEAYPDIGKVPTNLYT